MISTQELSQIDNKYFNIIQANPYVIYLQSRNTGHFWGIQLVQFPHFRNFKVFHKHHSHLEYHRHKDAPSIKVAIQRIKSHDRYQLNGRRYSS